MPYPGRSGYMAGPQGAAGVEQGDRVTSIVPLSLFFLSRYDAMGGRDGGIKLRAPKLPKTGCKKKGVKKSRAKIDNHLKGAGDTTHAGTDASMDATMDNANDSVREGVGDLVAMGWEVHPAKAPSWSTYYTKGGKKLHKKGGVWYIDDKKLGRLSDKKLVDKLRSMNESDEAFEGITTTANVATTPIPIGQPLKRLPTKKKQKKKNEVKAWTGRLIAIGQ